MNTSRTTWQQQRQKGWPKPEASRAC